MKEFLLSTVCERTKSGSSISVQNIGMHGVAAALRFGAWDQAGVGVGRGCGSDPEATG